MRSHKNCWHSVFARFEEVVAIPSVTCLGIMVAGSLILGQRHCIAIWLSKIQYQKSFMLCWCLVSGGNCSIATTIFACKGDWYFEYGLTPLHSVWIFQKGKAKIVDAPLMLHWRSILGWGNEPVASLFTSKDGQCFLFQRIRLCSPLTAKVVRLKFVHAPLTITLKTY